VGCLNKTTDRNIGLIGFMGTGKTTIGRALARVLRREFADTDALVETRAGKTIEQVFSEDGKEVFRSMESAVVREVCDHESCVISFGGGVVLSPSNVEIMKRNTTMVLLRASAEVIASRVSSERTRPLLRIDEGLVEQIRDLLQMREVLYLRASDVMIDTDTMGVEDSVEEIRRRLFV
jgi:shikimate kinase